MFKVCSNFNPALEDLRHAMRCESDSVRRPIKETLAPRHLWCGQATSLLGARIFATD
jgi:hypothetical protein